jgi:Flp pilus assembly protein TadG
MHLHSRARGRPRRGVALVESAFVYPIVFFFVLGLVVGAMGIFRYQEVATLARETARYASVHGTLYARDAGTTPPTAADIYNAVVVNEAVGLDLSKLTYSITWNVSNAPYQSVVVNGNITPAQNTVSVTITYQWVPEAFLGGITLSSTSVMPMTY